jgi:hypothetical protein
MSKIDHVTFVDTAAAAVIDGTVPTGLGAHPSGNNNKRRAESWLASIREATFDAGSPVGLAFALLLVLLGAATYFDFSFTPKAESVHYLVTWLYGVLFYGFVVDPLTILLLAFLGFVPLAAD